MLLSFLSSYHMTSLVERSENFVLCFYVKYWLPRCRNNSSNIAGVSLGKLLIVAVGPFVADEAIF